MASPFPATAGVIKVEDEENGGVSAGRVPSDQELRNKFREAVKRGVELRKRGLCASGSAQLPPPPLPPPVRHNPSLPPFQHKACEFCVTKSWSDQNFTFSSSMSFCMPKSKHGSDVTSEKKRSSSFSAVALLC